MFRTTRMSLALLATLLAPCIAGAQQAGQRAHELSAFMITLPPTDPGMLSALPCGSCASLTLSTTSSTQYLIGERRVSLQEMRRELAAHPEAFVFVSVAADLRSVRRVVMSAAVYGE